jgi:hypothetical protein
VAVPRRCCYVPRVLLVPPTLHLDRAKLARLRAGDIAIQGFGMIRHLKSTSSIWAHAQKIGGYFGAGSEPSRARPVPSSPPTLKGVYTPRAECQARLDLAGLRNPADQKMTHSRSPLMGRISAPVLKPSVDFCRANPAACPFFLKCLRAVLTMPPE